MLCLSTVGGWKGVNDMPFDLAGIVAACFLKSATMAFNMDM